MSYVERELPSIGDASVTAVIASHRPDTLDSIYAGWDAYPYFSMEIKGDEDPFYLIRWPTAFDRLAALKEVVAFGQERGEPDYMAYVGKGWREHLSEEELAAVAIHATNLRVESATDTLSWRLRQADEDGLNRFVVWAEPLSKVSQFNHLIGRTAIQDMMPVLETALPALQIAVDTYAPIIAG
ncbi:MAG TPA: hypothetical protein VG992_04635 [Candidatus Saccharimonadales bacterium]|nr:hypothetical protein [Candidatus Saccharimonadales bacterium]